MSTEGVKKLALRPLPPDRLLTVVTAGVVVLVVYQLVLALWMAASPHGFFKQLGPFGIFNAHYIRDLATYNAAIGVSLALAIKHHSWRVPLLALLTLQSGMHSVNHIVDINKAHPTWIGYLDVVTLVGTTVVLYWLTRAAMTVSQQRSGVGRTPKLTSADS